MNEWIKIEDCLPAFGELVWIIDDHHAPRLCERTGDENNWEWLEAEFAAFGISKPRIGPSSIIAVLSTKSDEGITAIYWHPIPKMPEL